MSKVFYDYLVVLEEIDIVIKEISETSEEREELWQLVDEIIHQRVLSKILSNLPKEHHEQFLDKFYDMPYDDSLVQYLQERMSDSIEQVIVEEVETIKKELLKELGEGDIISE